MGTAVGTADGDRRRMTRELDPEYVTVGGVLLAPQLLGRIRGWLCPDDFARPACREVYEVLLQMDRTGTVVDPVTVLAELRRQGRLNRGGFVARELVAMVEAVPTPAAAPHYARLVLEASMFRAVDQTGRRLTQLGRSRHGPPEDVLAIAARLVAGLREHQRRWRDATGADRPPTARPPGRGQQEHARTCGDGAPAVAAVRG